MMDMVTTGEVTESASTGPLAAELGALAARVGSATIDGLRVIFAHREGPVTASLVFRVGWADEPLARAGITHLIEHLALFDQNLGDVHHNGLTGDLTTQFHATGSVAEVVEFVNRVCAALDDLPLGRLEVEKEILHTEAAARGGSGVYRQRIERYGAATAGLAAWENFGLSAITADAVRAWARERFTRENAVLWITTPSVPDGLEPRLPSGAPAAAPEWPEVSGAARPALFTGGQGGVLVDAVVPRSAAAVVYSRVASRSLFRALRQEGGYSYTADCAYDPISATHARITLVADALKEKQAATVGGLVDVMAQLRRGTIDEGDLAAARTALRPMLDLPDLGAAMLPSAAQDLLLGAEINDPVDLVAGSESVTAAQVAEIGRLVWNDAIAQIPEGHLDWAGFTGLPLWSDAAVTGRTHPRHGEKHGALKIGDEGVSLLAEGGAVTVRFADCVALEKWPDGCRHLVGHDGFVVRIEPTLHAHITPDVIASIDSRVPADNHVLRPARSADEIPARPETAAAAPSRTRGWMHHTGVVLGVVALATLGLTVNDAIHMAVPHDDGTFTSIDSVLGGLIVTSIPALASGLFLVGSRRRSDRARDAG